MRRLDQRGVTSLEFAIICAVFLVTLFSIMDLGLYFMTKHSVREATNVTMRAALLDPTLVGCARSSSAIEGRIPLIDNDRINICVGRDEDSGSSSITVSSTYYFQSTTMGAIVKSQSIEDVITTRMPS